MKGKATAAEGSRRNRSKRRLNQPKLRELVVHIDGMHCQNCKNRIEKHLDELDGVVAKVNLNKKQAVVSIYRGIDDSVIRDVIEGLDFTVVSMEQK